MSKVFVCSDRNPRSFEDKNFYCEWIMQHTPRVIPEPFLGFLAICDEVWVFVRDGRITSEMQEQCEAAISLDIPLRWFISIFLANQAVDAQELKHLASDIIPQRTDLMLHNEFAVETQNTFAKLEERLRNGELYEDCDEGLDDVLGTGLDERDAGVEAEWERNYRGEED